jgi:hypothetical protein
MEPPLSFRCRLVMKPSMEQVSGAHPHCRKANSNLATTEVWQLIFRHNVMTHKLPGVNCEAIAYLHCAREHARAGGSHLKRTIRRTFTMANLVAEQLP